MPPRYRRHAALALALAIACAAGFRSDAAPAAVTRVSPYLTRAEAAAIVLLASPTRMPTVTKHPYVDVLPDDWFAPTFLAAAKLGIVTPDATGTRLRPFGSVNRAAFLKMLSQSFGLRTYQRHGFTDVPWNAWYAPYAGTEEIYRLFSHADPSKLEPDRLVTQDEARVAMQAFLRARSKAEDEEAKRTAIAQSKGKTQLYTVISTKLLRVVLVGEEQNAAPSPPKQASSSSAAAPTPQRTQTTDVRADILRLVNVARAEMGLAPLARNAALEQSAQAYAEQMHAQGFFGHTDPAGKTLKDRVDAVRYYTRDFSADCQCVKGFAIGENLARGQRSADEAVKAWMESPSHRDAILGEDFTDLGVGVLSGVWVQHFGGLLVPE